MQNAHQIVFNKHTVCSPISTIHIFNCFLTILILMFADKIDIVIFHVEIIFISTSFIKIGM